MLAFDEFALAVAPFNINNEVVEVVVGKPAPLTVPVLGFEHILCTIYCEKASHKGIIIGKGGMDSETLKAMKRFGCVYVQAVGGAAALSAAAVKKVAGVSYLKEFGAAEAVWRFDVEDFRGVVAMDAGGNSLFDEVGKASRRRFGELTEG